MLIIAVYKGKEKTGNNLNMGILYKIFNEMPELDNHLKDWDRPVCQDIYLSGKNHHRTRPFVLKYYMYIHTHNIKTFWVIRNH